ncbi:High mobility group protein DSP1 [Orchesella cincta]|uniref:High mobility group protein DSP1 n=1 Tax=Orchesella cincta TaxID=48709 RepID=A0A1D2M9B9_ORCCI|nr:High mobility group protein DSP1 [Orchesella cincta]
MGGPKGGGGDGSSKKPKDPVSAYAFFVKISRDQWMKEGSNPLSFVDHSKKCAEFGNWARQEDEKAKDPNAPKRGLSAFFWFSHDERAKVKGANPGFGVADVAKVLGRMWGE